MASHPFIRRQLLKYTGAAVLAGGAGSAHAQRRPLRLAVFDQMPWAGRDADGKEVGVALEMARQLQAVSGIAIAALALPYARAVTMLKTGGADLMLAFDTGPAAGLPPPLEILGSEDIVVVGRAGTRFNSFDQLCGRTVGHMRRATYHPAFADAACIRRYEVNSYQQGLRMLMQERIDALIGVRSTISFVLRELWQGHARLGPALVVSQAGLGLYAGPDALDAASAARLRRAGVVLRREQRLAALLARYRQI